MVRALHEGAAMMVAVDEAGSGASPLVHVMANAALAVLGRIVVRAPVVESEVEAEVEHREHAMHELVARCGIKLRAPFSLLARARRPSAPPLSLSARDSSAIAPFARAAEGPLKRA